MLVYGDHHEMAASGQRICEINRQLDAVERMSPGLERHAKLVGVLIEAGQLLQGVADSAFENERCDRSSTAGDQLGTVMLDLGKAVCRSWDTRFQEVGALPRLRAGDWPKEVDLRVPEGFAFYAVYPEAYVEAARRLKLSGPARVIGIRSIGTSLGAVVAAAIGARAPVTVRPFGDPFARRIAIDAALEGELLDGETHYVIVDEGPGQSGSSFGAVAGWLEARGVIPERIALLTSHGGGPGPEASDSRRRWWSSVQREVGDFGDRWRKLVECWCAASIGDLDGPLRDMSGGAWRKLRYANERDWPTTIPAWERRKFLARVRGRRFLVKFAGLGSVGEEKLATARTLYSERMVPEPLGLVHGFLVERWCERARPLGGSQQPVADIGRYIGTRSKLLPAKSGSGASIDELLTMARRNISLELGEDAVRILDPWEGRARELERRIRRVRTDNKVDRHEWLRDKSGALIKTDAVDHHQAHDLIGCQDSAWDVAGAMAEFDLNQSRTSELIASVEDAGCQVDRELLDFYRIAYSAFRLGQARLGAAISEVGESRRVRRSGDRYAAELHHLLEGSCTATRPESSVG